MWKNWEYLQISSETKNCAKEILCVVSLAQHVVS